MKFVFLADQLFPMKSLRINSKMKMSLIDSGEKGSGAVENEDETKMMMMTKSWN